MDRRRRHNHDDDDYNSASVGINQFAAMLPALRHARDVDRELTHTEAAQRRAALLNEWRRRAEEAYLAAYARADERYARLRVPRALRDDTELVDVASERLRELCGCRRERCFEDVLTGDLYVQRHIRTRPGLLDRVVGIFNRLVD